MPSFYEFFAGAGMAREGLGSDWHCLFANDFDEMKVATYEANWGKGHINPGDINNVRTEDLPGTADMAWASFPCQDLSLAGNYAGIGLADDANQTRSGTFWAFWRLMMSLMDEGRGPPIIVLENVYGVLTAKQGRDFAAIGECFANRGYRFGALLIDAARFVPQSRARVFIVAVANSVAVPDELLADGPDSCWHPRALTAAQSNLSEEAKRHWVWWRLPHPTGRVKPLASIITDKAEGVEWHTVEETRRLISMMSPLHRRKLERMMASGKRMVGTAYRRTRAGIQRTELRDDGVAGCLRTPRGGSSRQFVVVVEGDDVRTRLMSSREAAALMGLRRGFKLPDTYNDAYHVAGDGVAVPVVAHLARALLDRLACQTRVMPPEKLLQAA